MRARMMPREMQQEMDALARVAHSPLASPVETELRQLAAALQAGRFAGDPKGLVEDPLGDEEALLAALARRTR